MNQEIELKLLIDPKDLEKLYKHPVISHYAENASPVELDISNTYFDTPNADLSQHGYTLRLRIIGNKAIQTLKRGGQVKNGLHERIERNIDLSTPTLDLSLFPQDIQKILMPFTKGLRPLFTTNFHRKIWMLVVSQSSVELVSDTGTISANGLKENICEIELELKSGDPASLWKIAKQLQKDIKLIPENKSKAERGYKLRTLGTRN